MNMKKTAMAVAIGAVLGVPSLAHAALTQGPVDFVNPADGVGTSLSTMTLKAGAVLLQDIFAGGAISTDSSTPTSFLYRLQTTMAAMNTTPAGGADIAAAKQEYEVTLLVPMTAFIAGPLTDTPNLIFKLDGSAVGSFTMRYDSPHPVGGPLGAATLGADRAVQTTGQNFYNGIGVLEGVFVAGTGNLLNNSINTVACGSSTAGTTVLDQGGGNGNQFGSARTSCFSGNTSLEVNVTSRNTSFFPDMGIGSKYVLNLSTSPQLVDPFGLSNPSAQFGRGSGIAGQPSHLVNIDGSVATEVLNATTPEDSSESFPAGSVNNLAGAAGDIIAESTGGTINFLRELVPEPGSVALLGLGLGLLGGWTRKRARRSK